MNRLTWMMFKARLAFEEPKNRAYRIGLARCLRELSEFDAAIRTLDDLLAADPNDAAVLTQRGYTDLLSGRPQQALPYFRRAFAIDTHELDLLANYALCLEQCGLTEEAKGMRERQRNADADLRELEEASKSVLNQPTDPLPRFRAAQLLARNGQFIEARRWVESALRVDPNHRPSQQLYAELLLKRLDPRPPTTPAKAGS